MKLEIDLSDIFCEGEEPCDFQEAVRQEVTAHIVNTVNKGIKKRLDVEVARVINEELSVAVKEQMPTLIANLMSAQYTPVDRWGDSKGGTTTFRTELVKSINEQMVYKKARYSSDQNTFTAAVDEVVNENLKAFKADFNKQVDETFTAAALEHARTKLAAKLNIK